MGRAYGVTPVPPFPVADGAAYANATALTDVTPLAENLTAANQLEVGTRLRFDVWFRYSNTGTPTLTLGIYSGTIGQAIGSAAVIAVTSALTTVSGVTNRTCRFTGRAQVRAASASGSILGVIEVSNVTTGGTDMGPATAPTAVTIDTTVARYWAVGAAWSAASASNTLTVHEFSMEVVN